MTKQDLVYQKSVRGYLLDLILMEVDFENHLSLHFLDNSRAALDCADEWCDAATAWRECGE
jgi:hypothetical protein